MRVTCRHHRHRDGVLTAEDTASCLRLTGREVNQHHRMAHGLSSKV
jgi:hypothetical protein